MSLWSVLALSLLGRSLLPLVLGVSVNVTVDDQGSDSTTGEKINYEGDWAIGPNCLNSTLPCGARPDPNQALDGTWHDTTYNPSVLSQVIPRNATFKFTGTAIYVYGMVDGTFGIDLAFFLDGEEAHYADTPTTDFDYKYHQLYFQAEGLNNTPHYWRMQNGLGGETGSVVLFDYLVYTKEDDAESSTSLLPTAALSTAPEIPSSIPSSMSSLVTSSIASDTPSSTSSMSPLITSHAAAKLRLSGTTRTIVVAVGVIAGIAVVILLMLLYRARRRRQRRRGTISVVDYVPGYATVTSSGSAGGQFQHSSPFIDAQASPFPEAPPTYYGSPSPAALLGMGSVAPRVATKARYTPVPVTVTSSSSFLGGQQGTRDGRGEMEEIARSNVVGVRRSGSSVAAETAPPMYQSEAGAPL
ncbi:hypothetical protein PsYK624_054020 [Phanerochaete sordida]|uniref:Uncharacterized protein n=1 Tax=Phanerochaete sordida TaxID=48140 RepID=A0A9P3LBK7_9APHY|nr:hypothetical protein PsYK624_054020 [Phanerochaete sordida]